MINTRKENPYWEPSRKGFITNYPNFLHWKKLDVDEMQTDRPLNLYVHSPFCAQRCSYCYYRTITNSRKSEIDRYVDALCKEITLANQQFGLGKRPVNSVYFGGGTPTLLAGDNLKQITDTLRQHFNLDNAEFTVEGEPVTLTEKKADVLKELGVNRISLGVQSLSDDIIKLSNRQDTEAKVLRAIEFAKSTNAVVNIDLMSGLAGEKPDTWEYSVNRALETGVHSITVYKMELYTNTQYFIEVRNESLQLPSDDQELDFMQYALNKFDEAQYRPWSFFTFTKEGRYTHVHAPSIWRGDDCYAFGTSAFGRLGTWVYQNSNDADKYISMVEAGELPINRGHYLTCLDQMIRDVVLGMKLIHLDLTAFQKKHGFKLSSLCGAELNKLQEDGYITLSDTEVVLTPKGILHGDYVGKSLGKRLADMY
ncbi:Fe-S oxidoreductase, coproporphyrinogen III oxidase [Beggiatoa alba B18LD]|uniref:Fe-S oxidoreductase, coproporphyrinogen III oxidase n=1 Tax=Beggiatoa alba B18LD TaxID=395493 RepID=I3CDH9_9GAMM|nr:coproporphyrinogen-III oxidase family protein [Beggiatoa alba]EIJ41672.1 Fe-S oxidoreductase, coproporphyrinogen III oxidase [Beggiatoa alba B18LD]